MLLVKLILQIDQYIVKYTIYNLFSIENIALIHRGNISASKIIIMHSK
jgi:hypothetical protein